MRQSSLQPVLRVLGMGAWEAQKFCQLLHNKQFFSTKQFRMKIAITLLIINFACSIHSTYSKTYVLLSSLGWMTGLVPILMLSHSLGIVSILMSILQEMAHAISYKNMQERQTLHIWVILLYELIQLVRPTFISGSGSDSLLNFKQQTLHSDTHCIDFF